MTYGRASFSLKSLVDGDCVLKVTESISACNSVADDNASGAAAGAGAVAGADRVTTRDDNGLGLWGGPTETFPGRTAPIAPGRYIEWGSSVSLKFEVGCPLPELLFVVPPARARPWDGPALASAHRASVAVAAQGQGQGPPKAGKAPQGKAKGKKKEAKAEAEGAEAAPDPADLQAYQVLFTLCLRGRDSGNRWRPPESPHETTAEWQPKVQGQGCIKRNRARNARPLAVQKIPPKMPPVTHPGRPSIPGP